MELNEIMRLVWQGLINLPSDAPEREEAIRAYGALTSRLGYTPPGLLLVTRADGYTDVKFATDLEEIKLGERMIEVPLERPFPRFYGDWVSLAENIKEKFPDDPVMRASVNYQLNLIAREEDVTPVVEEAEVEEAKRWLTKRAGELGIK